MGPVEGHVARVLEDVMVGMTHDGDVAMAGGALGTQGVESVLGVGAVAADGLGDLLVDNNVDLDPGFSPPLQDLIESPFLVEVGWPPQEQLWTQPPVLNVNGLLCLLQGNGDGVEIVLTVDIPLDLVPISFRCEGVEAMAFSDASSFLVSQLLMLFVMAMVGIDDVALG